MFKKSIFFLLNYTQGSHSGVAHTQAHKKKFPLTNAPTLTHTLTHTRTLTVEKVKNNIKKYEYLNKTFKIINICTYSKICIHI